MTKTDRPQVAHELCLRAFLDGHAGAIPKESTEPAQPFTLYCELCLRELGAAPPIIVYPRSSGDPTADALIAAGRRATRERDESSQVYRGIADRGAAADREFSALLVSHQEMEIWKRIHEADRVVLTAKRQKYGDSWKRRGGTGAFHVGIRMADRLDAIAAQFGYDIFAAMQADVPDQEGMLNAIGDLRRYLLLWEGEYRLRQQPLLEVRHD